MANKIQNTTLSVVIIAKNEQDKIKECLESVSWADEIVLVDTGSTDKTNDIAKKHKARITIQMTGSYDTWRNKGLRETKGDWILYIDADERVPPPLRKEIIAKTRNQVSDFTAYAIPRRNFILGKEFKHGGEWPDYQKRLFLKKSLKSWKGKLHETPIYTGELGYLKKPLHHLKHDNLSDMVTKTNIWSEKEAKLLFNSNHPKMSWWRFLRIMITETFDRLVKKKGFMDGSEGIIYSFYQAWSKFITYGKLWEMQNTAGNKSTIE
jgi:glycosyltransferase involved in cell wall biosynthesis